ncbi:MAG: hypothetical protein OEX81_02315 [Candidatus Pacebacteria bacterium]|nr:hypothetical protein [Candidatus Paceibacterota bacterium]
MTQIIENSSKKPKESIYSEYDSDYEDLSTDDALLVTYDDDTDLYERKLLARQVVDCIVIALWGKTPEGDNFISLIHKSSPSTIEKLMKQHGIDVSGAKLSYLLVPGPDSQKDVITKTKAECKKLFDKEEASTDKPDKEFSFTIEQHERPYDKSSVVITGLPNDRVSVRTICPRPDDIREKMAIGVGNSKLIREKQ